MRLLRVLVERDIKLRYKQTVMGKAWALLQPLLLTVVFTLLFGKVLAVSTDVPYPLFAFTGLVPWALFSTGLSRSTVSLVANFPLIQKSNLPRILLPLSTVLAPLFDVVLSTGLLLIGMAVYGVAFSVSLLAVVPLSFLAVAFAFGLGLWLSAVNVQFRDVQHAMPFLLYMAMLASPVAYGTVLIEGSPWYWVYEINPMAGVIEGWRWACLHTPFPAEILWKSSLVNIAVLVTGLWFFRWREPIFADVV